MLYYVVCMHVCIYFEILSNTNNKHRITHRYIVQQYTNREINVTDNKERFMNNTVRSFMLFAVALVSTLRIDPTDSSL